jgi:hypothetical protein
VINRVKFNFLSFIGLEQGWTNILGCFKSLLLDSILKAQAYASLAHEKLAKIAHLTLLTLFILRWHNKYVSPSRALDI